LETFTPHSNKNPKPEHLDEINNFLDSQFPISLPTKLITPNKLKYIINKLKIGKLLGYDLISNKILKHLPKKKTLILLIFIYKSMLRLLYFFLTRKFSLLIHKPLKPKNVSSPYRPTSLPTTLSKIFENILLKRIKPII
jgi:hypothetical protein